MFHLFDGTWKVRRRNHLPFGDGKLWYEKKAWICRETTTKRDVRTYGDFYGFDDNGSGGEMKCENPIAWELSGVVMDVTPQEAELSLLELPPEIHLEIFKHLDSVSSTCLGVASRKLYPIHNHIHGKVSLAAWCIQPPKRGSGKHLFELLNNWMPPELEFFGCEMKFLKKNKSKERQEAVTETMSFVLQMKLVQEQAKAWKEQGGWYEDGDWQSLSPPQKHY